MSAVLLDGDLSFYNILLLLAGINKCKRLHKFWDQRKKPAAVKFYLFIFFGVQPDDG